MVQIFKAGSFRLFQRLSLGPQINRHGSTLNILQNYLDGIGGKRDFGWWWGGNKSVPSAPEFPQTRKSFNHEWTDSYSWMEAKDKRFWDYLEKEQQHFDAHVANKLSERHYSFLTDMQTKTPPAPKSPDRERLGNYEYFTHTSEERPHDHYMRINLEKNTMQSVLDINDLVNEHNNEQFAVGQIKVSPSQKLLAYSVKFGQNFGPEGAKVIIKDIESGNNIESFDKDIHTLEWTKNENAVVYTSMPEGLRPSKVFLHKLGTNTKEDILLYEEELPENFLSLTRSKDGLYLFVCSNSKIASEVHFMEANAENVNLKLVQARQPNLEYYVEHFQGQFLILTNADDNLNNCVMVADPKSPSKKDWKKLVPKRKWIAIEDIDIFEDCLVLWEQRDGLSAFSFLYPKDEFVGSQSITGYETYFDQLEDEIYEGFILKSFKQKSDWGPIVLDLSANANFQADHISFKVSSPILKKQTVKISLPQKGIDLAKSKSSGPNLTFKPGKGNYECWQELCRSEDGLDIPLTLARRNDLTNRGPCLFEVYGCYGMHMDLSNNAFRDALMDRGWTLAYAHVRGGGEKGRFWHHFGRKKGKLQALKDTRLCLKVIEEKGYAKSGQICLHATSAGAILSANLFLEDPSKFGALVLRMPFLDLFTALMDPEAQLAQHEWDEFGNPNDANGIQLLEKLCPYQNLQKLSILQETKIPPIFISAGVMDDRTPIWMAAKWIALLRLKIKDQSNICLNVEAGGHYLSLGDTLMLSGLETIFLLQAMDSK